MSKKSVNVGVESIGRDPIVCAHCAQTTFTGDPKALITIADGVSFEVIRVYRCRICGKDTRVAGGVSLK